VFPSTKLKKEGFSMRSQKLLFAIALCLCLSVVVSAHPGGTSSDGGHLNHSTGEYHYHHGYSAHRHYDMDGDGDWDCPYSFDDKTNSSENHSESYTFTNKAPSNKTESSSIKTESSGIKNVSQKETTKKRTTSDYIDIICWLIFAFWLLMGLLRWALDEIRKRFKK
jgi:hypothetical protein